MVTLVWGGRGFGGDPPPAPWTRCRPKAATTVHGPVPLASPTGHTATLVKGGGVAGIFGHLLTYLQTPHRGTHWRGRALSGSPRGGWAGGWRRLRKRLGLRLLSVTNAFELALGVGRTVAGHRLGALEGWKGTPPPPFQ